MRGTGTDRERRTAVVLLAWVVGLAAVAVSLPPQPAAAAACTVAGRPGSTADWVSDGEDDVAQRLADEAGVDLPPARPGYRWSVPVCVSDADPEVFSVTGARTEVEADEAAAWEAAAVEVAIQSLQDQAYEPEVAIAPAYHDLQVAGLETWLAIDPATWVPLDATGAAGEVEVTARAQPVATTWTFSDLTMRCEGPGEVYTPGAPGPAPCGREWPHTTSVGPMTMEVVIEYSITWSSTIGGTGTATRSGDPLTTYDLDVGEIQGVGTEGGDPLDGGPNPDRDDDGITCDLLMVLQGLCSPDDRDDDGERSRRGDDPEDPDCDLGDLLGDIGGGIIDIFEPIGGGMLTLVGAGDGASAAGFGDGLDDLWDCAKVVGDWTKERLTDLYNLLPPELRFLVDLTLGCSAVALEFLQTAWEGLKEAAALADDPVAFVEEKVDELLALKAAIEADPEQFALDMFDEIIDRELYDENRTQWVAKMVCDLIVTVVASFFSGGGYAAARFGAKGAQLVNRLRRIFPDLPDNRRDRGGDHDDPGDGDGDDPGDGRDGDGPTCGSNSFPAGTRVLMADGSRRPIEGIQRGELVVAADVATGRWTIRAVLDRWSHLDDGRLAQATLADGGRIGATDHHRFWLADDRAWSRLDDVEPGDHFLSPTGPVEVTAIAVDDRGPTEVWELDIAVDDTFAVDTGRADVLVHNGECSPETAKTLRDEFGIDVTKIEGDTSRLDDILREARSDNPETRRGALAELATLRRLQREGKTIELLTPSTEPGVTTPDLRVDGKLTELKATSNPEAIHDAITDANHQIKESEFGSRRGDPRERGRAEITLTDGADQVPIGDLDREIRRSFNENRGRELDSVAVYDDQGNLLGEWKRNDDGTVTQTYPTDQSDD